MKHTYLILILFAMALFSCDQENMGTLYEPDVPYVAFSSPVVSGNVLSAENDFSVNVQLVRSNLSGPATATVSLEMNANIEGVFDLESTTVTFEDGKGTAYVKIVPQVEPGQIDPTKNYVFNLTLTGDNVSELYNKTSYRASFRYSPLGTGSLNSDAFGDEWPVEIEVLEVGNTTLYKVKGMYETGYDITIKAENGLVEVDAQAAWYHDDYGDVYVEGNGTQNGKVLTMLIDHHVPGLGSFGEFTEVLTLP